MINNNEQGKILYATFLPILALVLVLIGAGWFLVQGEFELPKLRRDPTEIRRLEGFPTIASDTNQLDKQRLVIKSEDELNQFLNEVDPEGRIVLKEKINFDKEMIIAASTETNPMYGYDLRIKRVTQLENSGKFLVTVVETRPGENCEEDQVPNIAIDLIALKKTDVEVDFERVKEETKCEVPNI